MGLKVERLDESPTFPLTWNDIRETPGVYESAGVAAVLVVSGVYAGCSGAERAAFWISGDTILGTTTYDRSNRRFRASGRVVRLALSNEG
jgi:hypothetical protein